MSYLQNIQSAVTAGTATLYWERDPACSPQGIRYQIGLDGAKRTEVTRTHVTLEGLQPDTEYAVRIEAVSDRALDAETVQIRTACQKRRIDVTREPYLAKGDGAALNTGAIQRALDDCTASDAVYFPAGVYRTGALRLHSDMEIYLEEGAVLQGTADPADYLPKIPSRFEGIEMECYASLLNMGWLDHTAGANCGNVLIHGKGTIASGGQELALAVIRAERERLRD